MEKEKTFIIDSIKEFLNNLDSNLGGKLSIYMIGGGAMCLKNLNIDFMDGIENPEKHIPSGYLEDIGVG